MGSDKRIQEKMKVIFLAEDDQDDVALFQTAVSTLGAAHQVRVFKNGQDILKALTEGSAQNPDIIFLDINMPVKNGLEALVEIREHISKHLPVFLLSTANDRLNVELARKSGATGYLAKPDFLSELSQMLENVLSINWELRSVNDFYVHLRFSDAVPDDEQLMTFNAG